MNAKEKKALMPKLRFPEFRETGEWSCEKTDHLVDTVTPPKKLPTSSYGLVGKFPIIDQSQSEVCGWTDDSDALVHEGLPLIIFGDHTCSLKFVSQPFAQGADGIKILKSRAKIASSYLYQYLNYQPVVTEEYKRHYSILKEKLVLFPQHRTGEQQKIADCLSSLDELIAAQARKVEALKTHKKGLMQQLFPIEGETQPRLRFPEFQNTGPWKLRKIGSQLVEAQRPIALSDEAEYHLVTVKRRYGGLVSRGVMKGREILVKSQFLVNTGDFLISKRQIVHNACGLVPKELDGSVVSNEYSVLTPKGDCSIEFFSWFAMQPAVSASFMNCSVGIVIEKMLFKLPAWLKQEFLFPNLQEQERIASCLGTFDDLITSATQELETLKIHKKGLMQQLFPSLEAVEA